MKYNPNKHRRRSMRLDGYDYSARGAYFVTICTYQRACLFADIVDGELQLTPFGKIAEDCWQAIPRHFPHAQLSEFIVMPNHLHGIILLKDAIAKPELDSTQENTFGKRMKPGALSTIVRSFKSATTKQINIVRTAKGTPVWQRNYYDHIIRNEISNMRIQEYIRNNPLSWQTDQLHPKNPSKW